MAISLPIVSKFDDKGVNQAATAVDKLRGTLKTFAGVALAAFSVDAVIDFGRAAIAAAEDAQVANNRLEAIAKSMGLFGSQTANVTGRLQKFADTLALSVGIEDEAIKAAQAQLLTFKNLAITADQAGGAFDRATKAVIDLAAAGLGSLDTSAVQLGKALQDPVKGLTALGRAGVTFTDEQKELIKTLVETNRTLEAQDLILAAIEQQVGGTAEATATASQKMSIAWGEIQESIGAILLPAFQGFADWLVANLPNIQAAVEEFGAAMGRIFGAIGEWWSTHVQQPFEDFWKEHGPKFAEGWKNVEEVINIFLTQVAPVLLNMLSQMTDMIVNNVLVALEEFAIWFSNPQNKQAIQIVTATILALTGALFASVIAFMLVITTITFLVAKYTEFANWNQKVGLSLHLLFSPLLFLIDVLNRAADAWARFWGQADRKAMNPVSNPSRFNIPGRAAGGGASNTGLSWVGEKGPELITMPRGATVTPVPQHMRADALLGANRGGGVQNTYSITVQAGMGANGTQIGEEILKYISQYERGNGRVFVRA